MTVKRKTSTNQVFELFATKDAKITVRMLDKLTILVEGDSTAIEFLGKLLLAHAKSDEHSVQLSPHGAGRNRFSKESTLGFYVHKVPCEAGSGRVARPFRPKPKPADK